MAGYRLCGAKYAQTPYYIENVSTSIYSIEELCYYFYLPRGVLLCQHGKGLVKATAKGAKPHDHAIPRDRLFGGGHRVHIGKGMQQDVGIVGGDIVGQGVYKANDRSCGATLLLLDRKAGGAGTAAVVIVLCDGKHAAMRIFADLAAEAVTANGKYLGVRKADLRAAAALTVDL